MNKAGLSLSLIFMLIIGTQHYCFCQTSGTTQDKPAKNTLKFDKRIWDLKNTDPKIRRKAAHSLGKMGNPEAIPFLADILLAQDEPVNVRLACAWAIGKIGDPSGYDPLAAALQDTSPYIRKSVVLALGKLNIPQAEKLILDSLRNDPDEEVRGTATVALEFSKNPDLINELAKSAYDSSEGYKVRCGAIIIMAKISGSCAQCASLALPHFKKLIEDPEGYVRGTTAAALKNHLPNNPETLKILKKAKKAEIKRTENGIGDEYTLSVIETSIKALEK
ncbi:HEAT repeat domain-containing protein [Elusimicrobiota bacterium]